MKKVIKLNETALKNAVAESVKKVLKEYSQDIDTDSQFGGGMPDSKPSANKNTCEKEVTEIFNQIKPYIDKLAYIFNNNDTDDMKIYDTIMDALNEMYNLPGIAKHFYSIEVIDDEENY